MPFVIPKRLIATCQRSPAGRAWLDLLPNLILDFQNHWSLSLESPFDGDGVSCALVARAVCRDGTRAVLKLGMPHMEATHEIQGLRFWAGEPCVRLLQADIALNAMLIEDCEPGTSLRDLDEPDQDIVISQLLRRLWRRPPSPHPFRPLSDMTQYWATETLAATSSWNDAGLVREGLRLFEELSCPGAADVLLGTDTHAGNVLRAQREPWLVIDPKPFVGDRAYDVTQHLFNCAERMHSDPLATIARLADLLDLDAQRIRLWMFARAAAEPRVVWDEHSLRLARTLRSSV